MYSTVIIMNTVQFTPVIAIINDNKINLYYYYYYCYYYFHVIISHITYYYHLYIMYVA
jgi:hypothetical protein